MINFHCTQKFVFGDEWSHEICWKFFGDDQLSPVRNLTRRFDLSSPEDLLFQRCISNTPLAQMDVILINKLCSKALTAFVFQSLCVGIEKQDCTGFHIQLNPGLIDHDFEDSIQFQVWGDGEIDFPQCSFMLKMQLGALQKLSIINGERCMTTKYRGEFDVLVRKVLWVFYIHNHERA